MRNYRSYTVNLRECFLFCSGDRLVYHCDNEIDGVYGGIDESFEAYGCTDEGIYSVPNPSKQQLARGEHGWPLCISQEGCKNFKLYINNCDCIV